MGSVDNVSVAKSKRAREMANKELKRRQKANDQLEVLTSTAVLLSSSSSDVESDNADSPDTASLEKCIPSKAKIIK